MKILIIHLEPKLYKEFKILYKNSGIEVFFDLSLEYTKDANAKRFDDFENNIPKGILDSNWVVFVVLEGLCSTCDIIPLHAHLIPASYQILKKKNSLK